MAEKLVIQMAFPGKDGRPVPVELPFSKTYQVISDILKVCQQFPGPPTLELNIPGDPNPAQATGFQISQIEGDPVNARLSIVVGATHLHVSVPIGVLMHELDALKRATEPDPTSSHRPN